MTGVVIPGDITQIDIKVVEGVIINKDITNNNTRGTTKAIIVTTRDGSTAADATVEAEGATDPIIGIQGIGTAEGMFTTVTGRRRSLLNTERRRGVRARMMSDPEWVVLCISYQFCVCIGY